MARAAALGVDGVISADADMDNHTVTVELRDESVPIGAVVKALAAAGFTTGEPALKGTEKR